MHNPSFSRKRFHDALYIHVSCHVSENRQNQLTFLRFDDQGGAMMSFNRTHTSGFGNIKYANAFGILHIACLGICPCMKGCHAPVHLEYRSFHIRGVGLLLALLLLLPLLLARSLVPLLPLLHVGIMPSTTLAS
jgi:hypothetical protein